MKVRPEMKDIERDMQAGRLSLDGFLGNDTRSLEAIINEDDSTLKAINTTAEAMGRMMRRITRAGMEAQGEPVEYDGYQVEVMEYKGWIPCPFKDNRKFSKRITNAVNLATGEGIQWTDVGVHLIKDHGFFQGHGSPYRLDPIKLAAFLRMEERASEEE